MRGTKDIWAVLCHGRTFGEETNRDEFFETKHTFRLEKYKNQIDCDIFNKYYQIKNSLIPLLKELNELEDQINDKYPLMQCAGLSPKSVSFRYGSTESLENDNEKIVEELIFYINSKKLSTTELPYKIL